MKRVHAALVVQSASTDMYEDAEVAVSFMEQIAIVENVFFDGEEEDNREIVICVSFDSGQADIDILKNLLTMAGAGGCIVALEIIEQEAF